MEKKSDTKINEILQAARKRFATHGLAKTTMNEIAEDLCISKASLYYYFTDKEQIYKKVIEIEQQQFLETIEKLILEPIKASEKLKFYAENRLFYFRQLICLSKLTMESVIRPILKDLMDAFWEKEIGKITEIIEQGIENGEFKKVDARFYADIFAASMYGLRMISIRSIEHSEGKSEVLLNKQKEQLAALSQLLIEGISL